MAMIVGMSCFAQEAQYAFVGDTTSSSNASQCPLPGYYGYHKSAVMYTAEELLLTPGSLITDLAWQTTSFSPGTLMSSFNIYLLETSDDDIPGSTIWSDLVSNATLVYSGAINASPYSWANFTLTTSFTYNGGNLVVITDGQGCSSIGGCTKGAINTGEHATQSWMLCKDNTPFSDNASLSNCDASSTNHRKFNIRISYQEGTLSCHPVSNITVSNINTNTAMVFWTAPEDGNNFLIQYKPSLESWDGPDMLETTTNSTFFSFDNSLESSTTYNFRVANLCSNGDTSAWKATTFKTLCSLVDELPLFYDFETFDASTALPDCWDRSVTSSSTNPSCYNATYNAYAGSYSLYINNSDNIALLPAIDENFYNLNDLQLRFMLREGYNNVSVAVGFMSHPGDSFTPYDTVSVPSNGYPYEYVEQTVRFDEYEGPNSRIALKLISGSVYIDNLHLEPIPDCPPVQDIAVVSVDAESATITWTGTSESYLVRYRAINDNVWNETGAVIDSTSAVISDLEALTTYEVQIAPNCPETTEESYRGITFTTGCASFDLPYSINFEDALALNCWTVAEEGYDYYYDYYDDYDEENFYPERVQFIAHSGAFSMALGSQAGYHTVWAAPKMNENIENIRLEFYARLSNLAYSFGTLTVGLMTNPSDTATFVTVDTIPVNSTAFSLYMVNFNNLGFIGSDYYIAFRYDGAGADADEAGKIYIDDVTIMEAPTCLEPSNVQVSNVTHNSADVTWTSTGSSFTLYYKEAGDTIFNAEEGITELTYAFTGLTPSTTYNVYVATLCDDGSESASQTVTFTTACAIEIAPYTESFDASTIPSCWKKYSGLAAEAFNGTALTPFNGGWETSTAQVHNGRHVKLNIFGVAVKYWLVTPQIDLSNLANPALTFDLALTAYNSTNPINNPTGQQDDKFMVIISTDNGATWSEANATIWSNAAGAEHVFNQIPSNGEEITIPLTAYAGQTICIAFYGESTIINGDNDIHIDNVHVGEQVACTRPQGLTATATQTTATLSWNSTAPAFTVYYKTVEETEWQQVNNVTLEDGFYMLTGLTPSTTYDWYVETACGGEELSSNPAQFTTLMTAQTLPYSTEFSAGHGWLMNNGSAINYWTTGTPVDSIPSALYVTTDGTTSGYDVTHSATVMAEKLFTMPDGDSVHVEFDLLIGGEVYVNSTGYANSVHDYLKVFLVPDNVVFTAGPAANAQSDKNYGDYAMNFSADSMELASSPAFPYVAAKSTGNIHISKNMRIPSGSSEARVVFLWRNDNSSGDQPGAIIRNFSIAEVDTTPVIVITDPTVVTNPATNITPTSATISATITNPDNVEITARGFVVTNNATGAQTDITVSSDDNTFTSELTNLTPSTNYTFNAFITYNDTTVYGHNLIFTTLIDGIEEHLSSSISLYPNPACEYVDIRIDGEFNVTEMEVYDVHGKLVKTTNAISNPTRINVSGLSNGLYFVRVTTDAGMVTKPFIKK
jgi:hypothetical protein